jgi:outer membrane receptor protein involved in Fe transport
VVLEKGREARVGLRLERILGTLRVVSAPPGAAVQVGTPDAREQCTAPCELAVVPGRQVVVASLPGHVTARVPVEVLPDARTEVEVPLARPPEPTGKLVVTANKDRALVRVDGAERGFTPMVLDGIVAGTHEVTVTSEDDEPWTARAEVLEGRTTTVAARLVLPSPKVAAASKALSSREGAPASVTVITAEEIRAFGYRTVSDALRAVRGLYVTSDGIYDAAGVRGLSPEGDVNARLLLLVDGHTTNDFWTGQASIGFDLDADLSQVERIEVIRGPSSALYGSSAVFGLVNIVHRAAPRAGHVELMGVAGTQGVARGRVTAGLGGGEQDGPTALLTAAYSTARGPETQQLPGALPDGTGRTVRGGEAEQALHVGLRAKAGEFTLLGNFNRRPKATGVGVWGTLVNESTRVVDTRGFGELRWDHPVGEGQLTARAYADYVRYEAVNAYETRKLDDDGAKWAGAELRLRSGAIGGAHVLGVGLEYQNVWSVTQLIRPETGAPFLDDEHTAHVANAYLSDDWKLGPRASLQAALGLRAASTSTVGGATDAWTLVPNPRVALVARPYDDGVTKLMFGRAFRAPSVYERFYAIEGEQLPAPALQPEIAYTGEVEHAHRLGDDVVVTASAYGSRLSSLIVLAGAPTPPPGAENAVQFQNVADPVWVLGAEGELRWQPTRLTLVSFAYAFQYGRRLASEGPRELGNSPAHMASLRAMRPLAPGVMVAGEAVYGSPRLARDGSRVGEALLVNVTLSGEVPRLGLGWSLSGFNLLDDAYLVPSSYGSQAPALPQRGRMLQLSLTKTL